MFDREFHIRFTLAQVAKVLLLSPLVLLPAWGLMSLPWGSDSAPAWVQAVGSIAAVGVAILISSGQVRREQQERRQRDCTYMHKAFNTAFTASASANATYDFLLENINDQQSLGVFLQQMHHSLGELDRFSYAEMADIEFADLFTIQQRTLRLMIMETELFIEGRSRNILVGFAMMADKANQTVDELWAALEAYCERFGVQVDSGRSE